MSPRPSTSSSNPRPTRLEVGRIGKPHGLRGEVSVTFTTNRDERARAGARLHVDERELCIDTVRRHGERHIVRFVGIDDRDAAERLRGEVLTADPLARDPADLWVDDLVGVPVADRAGTHLGVVTAVEANPAHDLLVLDGTTLIPVVFVVERTGEGLVVDVPDGLLDVNA